MVKDLECLVGIRPQQVHRGQPDICVKPLGIDLDGDIEFGNRRLGLRPARGGSSPCRDERRRRVNRAGWPARNREGFRILFQAEVENASFHIGIRIPGIELIAWLTSARARSSRFRHCQRYARSTSAATYFGFNARLRYVVKGMIEIVIFVSDHPAHQERELSRVGGDPLREKRLGMIERDEGTGRCPTAQALAPDTDQQLVALGPFQQADVTDPVGNDPALPSFSEKSPPSARIRKHDPACCSIFWAEPTAATLLPREGPTLHSVAPTRTSHASAMIGH